MTLFKFKKLSSVLLFSTFLFLSSCADKESELELEIAQVPMEIEVERFDEIFFKATAEELPKVKANFPYLFPIEMSDQFWLEKKRDTLFVEVNEEVEKRYKDLGSLPVDIEMFAKHAKYYFKGESDRKKLITLVTEVDVTAKAVYADTLILVSLDTYLGKDHKFYQGFAQYLRPAFERSQLLPDLAENFIMQKMLPPRDRRFLGSLIHEGKILYAKEVLLPKVAEEDIIGYSKEQLKWAKANETEVWRYFMEEELLYSTDLKLNKRFIDTAPFSKFYLEIDNEAPGRIGAWIGWQIVRSYMKNNNVTLQELLTKSNDEVFQQSKYKPKK
ncbi:gliding motility lipoprotein GldB [Myroides pelagicus]|uniref:Gliding motility lipoprotein GldB n=1 Tax=Myroides pelagicus TaxID=270914 RepID=A0A7K1GSX8_9FLAO|nr:gliding motility lipoprotein GldB [Myroides pelagicus]MEC4112672.1 gliding motility lipoprotein GldB [Myroides pelagicus]MTH31063.1 gliding motility lipoprotein GldB [Myroides pelagicus]